MNQLINLATKMVVRANEKESIKLTRRFGIKPTSDSVYLKEAKPDMDKIMQINFL